VSGRRAKAKRRQVKERRIAAGQNPNIKPAPQHNFTHIGEDAVDTRRDRRLKRFRPKEHERQLKEASIIERRTFVNKWNRVFGFRPSEK
jgi:hypothetical protein